MSESAENPFLGIGAPPAGDDPTEQLNYLQQVVDAFHSSGNPRLKPLRQKLDAALVELGEGSERGVDAKALANEFGAKVEELRLQTYDLLVTVVNQARATLRVKLTQILPPNERFDTEKLQKALGLFAQGLRKTLAAARKGDAKARDEANALLDDAQKLMNESGHELADQR